MYYFNLHRQITLTITTEEEALGLDPKKVILEEDLGQWIPTTLTVWAIMAIWVLIEMGQWTIFITLKKQC